MPKSARLSGQVMEERERRMEMYRERIANGLDLYTGEPLQGQDAEDWQLYELNREMWKDKIHKKCMEYHSKV